MNKEVILLGTAASLLDTPWNQNDKYDYWACGSVISHEVSKDKKIDVVFELHPRNYWMQEPVQKVFADYLKINPEVKVYMQYENTIIKNSETLPLDELKKMAGHDLLAKYHTSTISYMVAMAIYKGYKRILLYGCHMSSEEEEYSLQRNAVEAWLCFGLGRGVDFWLTPQTDVMKNSSLYGYEQDRGWFLKLVQIQNGFNVGLKEYEGKLEKAKEEYNQQKGGCLAMERIIRNLRD